MAEQTISGDASAFTGDAGLRTALTEIVGESGCIFDSRDTVPYTEDYRRIHQGRTPAVVRPARCEEVAAVVAWCAAKGVPIVPQGGNTGLVNGSTPSADGREIVLSLSRMNRIRDLDPVDLTMTVEAGVTLQAAQEAATAADCMLPLAMSSEGSAQIGGVLSTNAGGNYTLRYGNARDLVLGLEVVLPDGRIWNGLRRLHKDNTGYCLRQLFVGAEGTLGVITAAVLKLAPRPRELAVAFCALPSVAAALELLVMFRRHHYQAIQAFEYLCGEGVQLVLKHFPETRLPIAPAAHYALVELAHSARQDELRGGLEEICSQAMDAGLILDAALAGSTAERAALWKLREEQADAHQREGPTILHDVSVQVSKVPEFIACVSAEFARRFPSVRVVTFGHVGDGNVHVTLLPAQGAGPAGFPVQAQELMDAVNGVVRQFNGSFSAEHGVGRLRAYLMPEWRGGPELETMRRIKQALDPANIMNPGKVLE